MSTTTTNTPEQKAKCNSISIKGVPSEERKTTCRKFQHQRDQIFANAEKLRKVSAYQTDFDFETIENLN